MCLGGGWVAVATDQRNVRLLSVGGVQMELFSIPGPVVSLAGHHDQLLVVFHRGTGESELRGICFWHFSLKMFIGHVITVVMMGASMTEGASWLAPRHACD